MKKTFFILLAFLSLSVGIQTLLSCSDSELTLPEPPPSSGIEQGNGGDGSSGSNGSSSSGNSSSSISSSSISSSSNVSSSSAPPPAPEINLPKSNYYPDGLSVTVPQETEYGVIHCETDGKTPSGSSAIKSGEVLNFQEKNAILQCAYYKDGQISGKVMRTYIIERLPDLPIVSIAVDPDDMFNKPQALYKSSHKPDIDCGGASATFFTDEEVPIYVDFFEKGANIAWSYPAGIHIHGGCSRMHPKKSVIVSFKDSYGQKNLQYPLFPEYPNLTKFKHFMLRNNGNNYPYDYIRDMLMSSLTEGLNIDYQKGRAVVVYYNGQYYGIHNLRERANSDYIETNYGINENNVDFVKVDNGGTVSKGSDDDYQRIVTWLNSNSLADNNNLKQLEQWVDVDNFTNHFQSRIYYKDCDWPGKNMKRWHFPGSKWRWLLYDTDHGFGSWGSSHSGCGTMAYITATNGPSWPNPPHSTFMLRKLLENESYKYAFINRFSLLIATYFAPEKVNARRTKLMSDINSEITYDQAKWGSKNESYLPKTMASFTTDRPAEMHSNIRSFWSLGSPVDFTLAVNGNGRILVHNLPLPKESVTFNAYPTIPITIKATGAGFKGWSDGVTDAERTVTITTATTLTANF